MSRWPSAIGLAGFSALVMLAAVQHNRQSTARLPRGAGRIELVDAPGTLYFRDLGSDRGLWYINPQAGRQCTFLEGITGEPSRELHNGCRWFLTVRDTPGPAYPNGMPRRELFAVSERGSAVQLTRRADREPAPLVARWPMHAHDKQVSWIARRWNAEGQVVEGGIYIAEVAFDAQGNISGLLAEPERPLLSFDLIRHCSDVVWGYSPVPDVTSYDWSPDGSALVYESLASRLYVRGISGGAARLLTAEPGADPVWCPGGTMIAFKICRPYGGIAGISPEGGAHRLLVPAGVAEGVVSMPIVSPDGRHVAFCRAVSADESDDPLEPARLYVSIVPSRDGARSGPPADVIPAGLPVAWR